MPRARQPQRAPSRLKATRTVCPRCGASSKSLAMENPRLPYSRVRQAGMAAPTTTYRMWKRLSERPGGSRLVLRRGDGAGSVPIGVGLAGGETEVSRRRRQRSLLGFGRGSARRWGHREPLSCRDRPDRTHKDRFSDSGRVSDNRRCGAQRV
jgi:hypothetical protein